MFIIWLIFVYRINKQLTYDRIEVFINFFIGDKAGYSGVALYSKVKPIGVRMGKEIKELDDNEGRVIEAEYEKFFLVSTCKTSNYPFFLIILDTHNLIFQIFQMQVQD